MAAAVTHTPSSGKLSIQAYMSFGITSYPDNRQFLVHILLALSVPIFVIGL